MFIQSHLKVIVVVLALVGLSSCARITGGGGGADGGANPSTLDKNNPNYVETTNTIWTLFNRKSAESNVQVNRYIWNASLQVLNFLPIQSVDPFTGVIATGYGTPPGGGRAYRATVLIDDPALEARSLNVALQSRSGPVAASTVRAIEDAILARARQLRIADNKL